MDVAFVVPMEAMGKKSHRARAVTKDGKAFAHTYKDKASRSHEAEIAAHASRYLPNDRVIEDPVMIDIVAYIKRPKKLTERYKKTNELKNGAIEGVMACPKKPDCDNVSKSVCDALKRWWVDDKLVTVNKTFTVYTELGGLPRMWIRIRTVTHEVVLQEIVKSFGGAPWKKES